MTSLRTHAWVLALAVAASCNGTETAVQEASPARVEVAAPGVPDAKLLLPEGIDGTSLSIVQAEDRFQDPGMRSIGKGFVCGPAGTTFATPVTIRLPVAQEDLAGYRAKPEQLAIFTRAEGEGRFHALPTRVVDGGKAVEADVTHFSYHQVGLGVQEQCLSAGHLEDCLAKVCALAELIGQQSSMQADARAEAQSLATQACALGAVHDVPGALTALGQLTNALVADLAAGTIDSPAHVTLVNAVRDAETSLMAIPTISVNGTWLASVPVEGRPVRLTLQLHQRANGTVMGLVLGGADAWTVAGGRVTADRLALDLELSYRSAVLTFHVEGSVTLGPTTDATYFTGLASPPVDSSPWNGNESETTKNTASPEPPTPVVWHLTGEPLTERRLLFPVDSWLTVALAVSGDKGLVSGTYSVSPCYDEGCVGQVYDMTESETGRIRLLVEPVGGGEGSVEMEFGSSVPTDPAYWIYTGQLHLYVGEGKVETLAPLMGFRGMGTTPAHAAHMLAAYARVADDLVAHDDPSPFDGSTYPPIASSYKHDGQVFFSESAPSVIGALKNEVDQIAPTNVEFSRFRNLATVVPDRTVPILAHVASVDFTDRRVGTFRNEPGTEYFNAANDPPFDAMRFLAIEKNEQDIDEVRVHGNQRDGRDMILPIRVEDLGALTGFWPFGVHGRNDQAAGSNAFMLDFGPSPAEIPDAIAPADMEMVFAGSDDPFAPGCGEGQVTEMIGVSGTYFVDLPVLDCEWTPTSPPYALGEPLGTARRPGEGSGYGTWFSMATAVPRSFCPFWRLSDDARAQLLAARNRFHYSEELVEPFLCNPNQGTYLDEVCLTWRLMGSVKRHEESPDWIRICRDRDAYLQDGLPHRLHVPNVSGGTTTTAVSCHIPSPGGALWWVCNTLDNDPTEVSILVTATASGAVLKLDLTGPDLDLPDLYYAGVTPAICDDSDPCTDDFETAPGICDHVANSAPCFGGDHCRVNEQCQLDGDHVQCGGGSARNCDDDNVCTDYVSCDPDTGCVYTFNMDSCDDGDACTTNDTCSGGACVGGAPPNCNDGNPCTDDSCNPVTGCVHTNNTLPCNDNDACTTNDTCSGGECVGGPPLNCNDGNPCTDDSCNPVTGCVHTNNTLPCNDGNACTANDRCIDGECFGITVPCDDYDICTDDSCNWATGCVHTLNSTACDDGNACTTNDSCSGGACVGGAPTNCDDGNPCTDDSCNSVTGCVHPSNTASCDDGNACTTNDACSGGACVGGAPPNCNDGNLCTDDSCDADTGCINAFNENPCDDGNACTVEDACFLGSCVGTNPVVCTAADPCHGIGTCDPSSGDCSNPPKTGDPFCVDGTALNLDRSRKTPRSIRLVVQRETLEDVRSVQLTVTSVPNDQLLEAATFDTEYVSRSIGSSNALSCLIPRSFDAIDTVLGVVIHLSHGSAIHASYFLPKHFADLLGGETESGPY